MNIESTNQTKGTPPVACNDLLGVGKAAYVRVKSGKEFDVYEYDFGFTSIKAVVARRLKRLLDALTLGVSSRILPAALLSYGEVHFLENHGQRIQLQSLDSFLKKLTLRLSEQQTRPIQSLVVLDRPSVETII
jgi:hypothetical protein